MATKNLKETLLTLGAEKELSNKTKAYRLLIDPLSSELELALCIRRTKVYKKYAIVKSTVDNILYTKITVTEEPKVLNKRTFSSLSNESIVF